MDFLQLQAWAQTFNSDRGWDLIPASMAMVHLLEELGELAEQTRMLSGATVTDGQDLYIQEVAGEMADVLILLLKIGVICDVDLSTILIQRTSSFDFRDWTAQQADEPIFTLETMPLFIVWLLDRFGELCRHIMFSENFKDPDIRKGARDDFGAELAYTIVLVVKTGEGIGVDMGDLLARKVEKISKRFSRREGSRETLRYLQHMRKEIDRYLAEFTHRFGIDLPPHQERSQDT